MTILFVWLGITVVVAFLTDDIVLTFEWPLCFLWFLAALSLSVALLFLMFAWAIGFVVMDAILGPNRYRW